MGDWEMLASGSWPSIETGSCNVMYREAEKELVVFYRSYWGFQVWSMFESNETWVQWNDTGMEPSPTHSRQSFTSSKDGNIGYYYGGYAQWGAYWDKLNIFFYSNKTWVQVDAPPTLAGRYWSEMVYDEATDSIWIFGGRDAARVWYNDLHQYNSTHGWTYYPSIDPKPVPRDQALMTMTPDGKRIFIALGRYGTGGGGTSYYRNDLWEYNVTNDNWTVLNNNMDIPTEAGGLLQYRSGTDDLILSMGFDGWNLLNDTYVIDISTGTLSSVNLTGGIPGRHVQAFDIYSNGRKAIVFGDDASRKDIWSVDLVDYSTLLTPGNPTWVGGSAFTGYDDENGGRLMALKRNDGDTWQLASFSLDSRSWKMLYVSDEGKPTYHSGMASVYDPDDNDFYLYGGYYSYQVSQWTYHYYFYDEFWKLDCDTGEWTRINEHASPGARGRAAMVVDPAKRMIYLYGGQVHGGDTDTLYQYNMTGNIWKAINPTTKPQGRMETAVTYDPNNRGFFMFGGQRNGTSNVELNDLWFFHTDTVLWEKLPTGDDEPHAQDLAGISLNTDTNELLLFGDGDDETFMWRLDWFGWKKVATTTSPGDWSGHGQAYSSQTRSHFAWAGDGTEVWEFNPILRTTAIQVQMFDPDGWTTGVDAVDVFPTLGTYSLKVRGRTDLPPDNFLGMNLTLETGDDVIGLTWDKATGNIVVENGKDWMVIKDGEELRFLDNNNWEFTVPMEFTFDMPHGDTVSAFATPVTHIGLAEQAKRLNLFRLNSRLEIVSYRFRTPIQPEPVVNGWLFGGTDLTVHDFKVAFAGYNDVSPREGNFKVEFSNEWGDSVDWTYIYNTTTELTVPVMGEDGSSTFFYLNVTDNGVTVAKLTFNFRIDMAPPGIVEGAALRADNYNDQKLNMDNDPEMFLTWDNIVETGSGLKGVCYSLDMNTYPDQENLTTGFKSIYVGAEGFHTLYVWAVDNTERASLVSEVPIVIDSHQIYYTYPEPPMKVNVTYGTFLVSITINDDLSGVDPNSIHYQYTMPNKQLSDWIKYEAEEGNTSSIRVSVVLDLVPYVDNLVIWKARDRAFNDERQSGVFVVHYDPDLKEPKVDLLSPVDTYRVEEGVDLSWKGEYINPLNLTYDLVIVLPDDTQETFPLTRTTYRYTPKMPGIHQWYVIAKADGKSTGSLTRTFIYEPDFAEVSFTSTQKVTIGYDYPLKVSMDNKLEVSVDLTFDLENPRGFIIYSGDSYSLVPGEKKEGNLVLNTSGAQVGTYKITINVTDSYGRFNLIQVSLVVENEDVIVRPDDDESKEVPIWLIICIILVVLILLIVIVMVFLRRKKNENDEIEEEGEEETPGLEYDPAGKVAKGGSHTTSHVPLSPGVGAMGEAEMRMRGTNVIELTIPTKKETDDTIGPEPPKEEIEENDMEELSPDEMANELYGTNGNERS
ncbi:MAG: hypothetical protein JXA22_10690 [Candidatus Thermoplasmatota archaeon]|nr:hypothetical protein [Candidatus Thermoplasmatota archaeon]